MPKLVKESIGDYREKCREFQEELDKCNIEIERLKRAIINLALKV